MGWEIRIDGGSIIDVGTTKPYTVTGLSPGVMHSAEVRRYNDGGLKSDWSAPVYFYTIDEVAIRLDAGRTAGGVISGFDVDTAYLSSASGTNDFADSVDITGLTDPAPAAAYSTNRIYTSEPPEYTFTTANAGIVPSKTYLARLHFNEGNESHVIGDSVMQVNINGSIASPIRDDAYRNTPYFDVRERAGAFHKGYIREYLGTSNGSGDLAVEVRNAVNNSAGDVRIAAIELKEAPPLAAFTATPGADQTDAVMFTDTTTGLPTSWAWDFGDGETSTTQHPSHTYDAAGTYEVTLTASNRFGTSEEYSATVTVLTGKAPSISPSTLPDATDGDAYSQALSAVDGDSPYSYALIAEDTDAREYTNLGAPLYQVNRRGALPNGLTLSSGGLLSGTPMIPQSEMIVLGGDSTIQGFITGIPAVSADYTSAAQISKLRGRSTTVVSVAQNGLTLANTDTNFASREAVYLTGDHKKMVYIIGAGTNDILNGTTLASMETSAQSIINKAVATGAAVIFRKIPVAASWVGGGAETKANDFNTWLEATATGIDAIVDVTDSVKLANGKHNAYWYEGGIHMTELGYIEQGNLFNTAINGVSDTGTGNIAVDHLFGVKVVDASGNAATKQYTLTVNP